MTDGSAEDVPVLSLTDELLEQPRAALPSERTIEEQREDTRKWIAYSLLGILAAVCLAWAAVGVWGDTGDVAAAGDAFDKIFAGVLGLTGTAVGFYFGSAGSTSSGSKPLGGRGR